jgi:hypothetical protein
MTQPDFGSSFRHLLNDPLPPAPDPRLIAYELFRRDRLRTRLLAGLSLFFWLVGTGGIFLLAFALNRLVIDVRVESYRAAHPGMFYQPPGDMEVARVTDFIHHSLPYVEASVVALMLAALFTVALIFSSRQATLNRINISLLQISEQLRGLQGQGVPAVGGAAGRGDFGYSLPPGMGRSPFGAFVKAMLVLALLVFLGFLALCVWYRAASQSRAQAVAEEARANVWNGFPRLSPFEAVRWEGQTPHVMVGGKWYELVSMNGLPAPQIVSFCKSLDERFWQKRFEEDLIEVLTRSGCTPGTTAMLEVKSLDTGETKILRDVPMTSENREALCRAGTTRPSQ